MKKTLRWMFLVTEINLLLWFAALGYTLEVDDPAARPGVTASWYSGMASSPSAVIVVGLLFALVAQHWAYYACYRKAKSLSYVE